MLEANFFYRFFKHNRNSNREIVQYNSNKSFDLQYEMNIEIKEIDKKISENSKALLEAQIVKLRSTFTNSNNFIEKIGQNVYKVKLEESINWHKKELKELYFRRKRLLINLEKLTGTFWLNRIKRFLSMFLIGLFVLLSLFIFLSGFMVTIYLLPLGLFILFIYSIVTKK